MMTQPAATPAMNDEEFLDLLFERIVAQLEEGVVPCAADVAAGCDHLMPRIDALIELAQRIRPTIHEPLPTIPGYTLLRELGRGGMGAVYLARQERLAGRPVALKVLPAAMAISQRARERFRDEVRAVARLSHPNIVAIHDVVAEDGLHAYAMEWIDGRTLAAWITERAAQGGPSRGSSPGVDSDSARICDIGIAIAQALAAVHGAGLLHRDVKPSNILLRRDGTPLLGDFGLARETDATLTQAGQFVGTAAYAPPEQLRGEVERIDRRSDVYALGATLYHALALRPPFDGHEPARLLPQIEGAGPRPLRKLNPRVPRDLATVLAKALEPDPARRYQTAGDLADDLARVRSLRPIRARPPGPLTRVMKLVRRRRGLLAAAIGGAALASGLLMLLGVYLLLAPGWVAGHVRAARLELIHPGHGTNIASVLVWGRINSPSQAAIEDWRRTMREALAHYDAALRLAPFDEVIRQERAVVLAAVASRELPGADARSAGLHAFLTWEYEQALKTWDRYEVERDPSAEPDVLVDAALGIMHLFNGAPARAYPRLRDACQALPNVGFLTTYHAEAALRCGDAALAERMLEAAAAMPMLDPGGALERVRAGVLVAQGRDEEAERYYKSHHFNPVARCDYGDFLRSRGRVEEALTQCEIAFHAAPGPRTQSALLSAADEWWASLSAQERLRRIRGTLGLTPGDPGSLVALLRSYVQAKREGAPAESRPDVPSSPLRAFVPPCLRAFTPSSALRDLFSSTPLESLSLSELAHQLEVENMSLWQRVTQYPSCLKEFQIAGWRWPALRAAVAWLAALVALQAATAPANASTPAAARIQNNSFAGNYLRIADHPGLEPQQFTIECWLTPRGSGSGNTGDAYGATVIAKPIEGGGGFSISSWLVMWSPVSNNVVVNVTHSMPSLGVYHFSSATVPQNTTAHVAVTFDGSTIRLYINGLLDSSTAFPYSGIIYGAQDVLIGAGNYCCGYDRRFDGEVDDVRLWNYPRSQPQIAAEMNQEISGPQPGLLAAWNFNCGDYRDVSGNGHHASAAGSVPLVPQNPGLIAAPYAIATAGDDQSVPEGTPVALDGSASSAVCGAASYAWSQVAGPSVVLTGADTATPSFTAPLVPVGGTVLTFQLIVSDGTNDSEPDVVNVHVTNINNVPVALADDLCDDNAVAEAGFATLDGSNSYDVDDEPLTYSWVQTGGVSVTLNDADTAVANFATPLVGPAGEILTFELTVGDGEDSATISVDVCIENINHLPVADAGAAQTVAEGAAVTLNATGSSDQDGDTLTFEWTQISGPAVVLTGDDTATPSFTAPQVGPAGATLVFRVTVDDGYGGSDSAEVTITVQDTASAPECHLAKPSVAELWPPNHKLIPVTITAITHGSNPAVSITILSVTQDEPVTGTGDGDTSPDAVIQGNKVLLRAERVGGGNGRVYRITFEASDGQGGVCTGSVFVRVPHDKGKNMPQAIDDGQLYNSLGM